MDVVALSNRVTESYRRYLETTFHFRDPVLRASFREALRSQYLSRGPFIEATPSFRLGSSPGALFEELLGSPPDKGFLNAVQPDRRLYVHQQEAIRKVFQGKNVIVATGTGSGKTEAFLYPILLHLYNEFLKNGLCPGVRALVLYPMNALANDQRERLGELCGRLEESGSPFRFTFGQYTGETPENVNDSKRQARDHLDKRLPGELVLRSEMREKPPHVLLTNYSMLEYLLLRPSDSQLFDAGRGAWWRFLVLDEAHQYRGSRGIEMAMLLRRLKQRIREGGCEVPLRCIATSASLAGGVEDVPVVARFASSLFGEIFDEEDVIVGQTEPVPESGNINLNPSDYETFLKALVDQDRGSIERAVQLACNLGIGSQREENVGALVGTLLKNDSRVARLRRLITGNPLEVAAVAAQVFENLSPEEGLPMLCQFVELLQAARDPYTDLPILSARYHLFLRSLEGAWVSYWPQKKVYLDRRSGVAGGMAFEVALCRECGQHYFVGRISNGRLVEAVRDPNDPEFGTVFLRPIDQDQFDEDGEENSSEPRNRDILQLCVDCGEVRETVTCGHSHAILVAREESPRSYERVDEIVRCGFCGYGGGHDPVREVVYGTGGPHSVVVTTLHKDLPEKRRKVLAFADGRQEAAYFAWYLENTYRDILSRNLLLQVCKELDPYTTEGLSLRELATGLWKKLKAANILSPSTGELELRREAWLRVYREFLTNESRLSLDGVGLVGWHVKWPSQFKSPRFLSEPPWNLSPEEARNLMLVLLDYMRADGAVELRADGGVLIDWSELQFKKGQSRVQIGSGRSHRSGSGVRKWDGERGRRARFLTRVLSRRDVAERDALEYALKALRDLWDYISEVDQMAASAKERLFLPVDNGRRLNPDWWRLSLIRDDAVVFRCDTCGRLQTVSILRTCTRPGCPGTLESVSVKALGDNHYRTLYEEDLPTALRVEEHTAQLEHEKAREFQRDFKNGRIHVLSCSTTFELGVDLGDLDTVFLRNVPPEPFNYAQRVGRAGRRRGQPGFAITFCRRGPHDLYHFFEPARILTGKARVPVLTICNEKIVTRHMAATALSAFFRRYQEQNQDRFSTVEKLFVDLDHPRAVSDIVAFLIDNKSSLEETLCLIVPPDLHEAVGLHNGEWIDRIAGCYSRYAGGAARVEDSRLVLVEAEIGNDYRSLREFERKAAVEGRYGDAKWARARAHTIAGEDVLSFLSRKAVLPKYGFPVDVVELDTQKIREDEDTFAVSLERDLTIALSEFAPTSQLIANKKLWTSYGLKRVAEKEWTRKIYKRCTLHNVFIQWTPGQVEPKAPCGCVLSHLQYVVPQFGFVTSRSKPREPSGKPSRLFTTRPYFAGPIGPNPGTLGFPKGNSLVVVWKASPGLMVVLCEGRRGEGFYLCERCGAGFRNREEKHKSPNGEECRGRLSLVSLAHEFETDVLKIQFNLVPENSMDPIWFAHSLAYALVDGAADILEVPPDDLSAVVSFGGHTDPVLPIVLYDNVPGGAGLVAQLEREAVFRDCLEAAKRRVSGNCGCDEGTSCYGCLRNYRNQFAHHQLQRGPIMRYLASLLDYWGQ